MAAEAKAETIRAQLEQALEAAGLDRSLWAGGLPDEVSLDQDLGVDSFQLMQVARHLEKAHGFAFSIADWVLQEEEKDEPRYTVGALIAFVSEAIG